jgi:hypothetical protein
MKKGTGLAWIGAIIMFIGNQSLFYFDYWIIIFMIGLVITILGSVLWARRKNRSAIFGLFGILAPIGFIVIGLLKDKTVNDKKL